ncbi:outer membrane protein, putative [Geobacter metallireducens RCH3]|uniref:Outer membrane protein, putative n=1 Tax=Geobacter metallireducens (strain ATCC 53774 / DSM 7210 / GS-15) TaxID=269799 RepID=Q39PU7_GEOMG|nr:OmpW family outer membrane protein [Geobacter metallireducens]ABB33727.1 outer membrane protein, putative [Geobacter metallireducens GS-15]EHP85828.1 outer membrane protein, putative [Geobacter metallireducens RCH3]
MKRLVTVAWIVVAVAGLSGTALADSIKGKLGVTGRLGVYLPAESDFDDRKLETDVGFIGGGGVIYGITDNIAAEIDVTHTEFGSNRVSGLDEGDFEVVNVSLGGQYRFLLPQSKFVPYAGGGLDILLIDYTRPSGTKAHVDTGVGVHVNGGVDYFVTRQLVLNAEVKGVIAPEVDMTAEGRPGNFDPSGVAGTVGVRFFFN